MEIEKHIGKIDDTLYNIAIEILQQNIRWINTEKEDLESLKSKLSSILLGESLPQQPETAEEKVEAEKMEESAEEAPSLPEPPEQPFVVYVKDTAEESQT